MWNERLKIQVEEKEKIITNLTRTIASLEGKVTEISYDSTETDTARQIREETEALHLALRNIAEAVINDADRGIDDDLQQTEAMKSGSRSGSPMRARSTSPRSRSPTFRQRSPNRSPSPRGRSRSPAFADATFSAVQAALNKRQLQVSDLRAKLSASRDHIVTLRKNIDDVENDKRRLELHILNLKEDFETA